MLGIKLRACSLGLVALLLVGSYAASAASAAAGPFWHHRASSSEGAGAKIEENAPEQIKGEGGEQKLKGKITELAVEITAKSVQVKGFIYNNSLQAQSRLELTYHELKAAAFPNCVITIGHQNTVKIYGHQAWKGEEGQLHPAWIFLPVELQSGVTALPKAVFANFLFASKNEATEKCVFHGLQVEVTGSVTGEIKPEGLEEWSRAQTVTTPENGVKQHFWNGTSFSKVETNLLLGGAASKLGGETKTQTAGRQGGQPQEVALFEV